MPATFSMPAPGEVYRKRRALLAKHLEQPLVVFAGQPAARNYATNPFPFRAGSSYLYLGGPPLEGASWLIEPGSDGNDGCTLFRHAMTPDDIVWFGEVPGDDEIARASGLDATHLSNAGQLESALMGHGAVYIAPPCKATWVQISRMNLKPAEDEVLLPLIEMRLIKDEYELSAMRDAAEVGVLAHAAAMKAAQPGQREADVLAAFVAVLARYESEPSFTPIITVRGEVLHASGYANTLAENQLLLIDAGAERLTGYASDITRTIPVGGVWTAMQQQIYNTVLRAQEAAIQACIPGRRYRDVHDLSARILCEGMVEGELLRGDPAELAHRNAHTLFFPHGVGHLIGIEVHDMEDFGDLAGYALNRKRRGEFGSKFLRLDRDLEPGMTVTIEPGIYLVPAIWNNESLVRPFTDSVNRSLVDSLLKDQFGGIRIEDTICVRADSAMGPEILTSKLPKTAKDIAEYIG